MFEALDAFPFLAGFHMCPLLQGFTSCHSNYDVPLFGWRSRLSVPLAACIHVAKMSGGLFLLHTTTGVGLRGVGYQECQWLHCRAIGVYGDPICASPWCLVCSFSASPLRQGVSIFCVVWSLGVPEHRLRVRKCAAAAAAVSLAAVSLAVQCKSVGVISKASCGY